MELEEAIEILKEFKKTGYHTIMAKYKWDRIKANTMIELAIDDVLTHITKQEKMIDEMASYIMCKVPFTKETRCLELKEDVRTKKSVKQYFEKKVEE